MRKFYEKYLKNLRPAVGIALFLAAALCFVGILFWTSRDSQKRAEDIRQQVQEREEAAQSEEADSQQQPGDTGQEAQNAAEAEAQADSQEAAQPTPELTSAIAGISCWGDDFMDANDSPTYAYPVILGQRLAENGKNIPVINHGLYGSGTLSSLRLAGVDEAEIQNYIAAHTAAAGGGTPTVTETGVRDFTPEELARTDQGYLPVIFMGFYGGWNNDPQELIAQQEKILATFTGNPQQYLILGFPNTGSSEGDAAYEQAMTQRWQDRYVSLKNEMQGSVYTYAGQAEIADIVYRHLEALGDLG